MPWILARTKLAKRREGRARSTSILPTLAVLNQQLQPRSIDDRICALANNFNWRKNNDPSTMPITLLYSQQCHQGIHMTVTLLPPYNIHVLLILCHAQLTNLVTELTQTGLDCSNSDETLTWLKMLLLVAVVDCRASVG